MRLNENHEEQPLRMERIALLVVGAAVTLGLIGSGVAWLYDSGLAPTSLQKKWLSSQKEAAGVDANTPLLDDSTVITLERTRCFGTCPAYKVSIYGSGRVEYLGSAFVCEKGPVSTKIDPALVNRLLKGFSAVNYFQIPNYVDRNATDSETSFLTVAYAGQFHVVEHYHGDGSAPRLLRMIEDQIDTVAGTSAWVGTYDMEQHETFCILPGGTRKPLEVKFM